MKIRLLNKEILKLCSLLGGIQVGGRNRKCSGCGPGSADGQKRTRFRLPEHNQNGQKQPVHYGVQAERQLERTAEGLLLRQCVWRGIDSGA